MRATEPVIAVIRELVLTNDKPRAEITLDVEILEVEPHAHERAGAEPDAEPDRRDFLTGEGAAGDRRH